MTELRIRLLGGAELYGAGGIPTPFPTRRARSIFCYLALNQGRLFDRDVLRGQFWPEQSDTTARKGLRTALWRIRQSVEDAGGEPDVVLYAHGCRVGLRGSAPVWVDAREFEDRVRSVPPPGAGLGPEDARVLAGAVELYRGDLVEGIYDDWCTVERERLRLLFLGALERLLIHHVDQGEWRAALARGHELLRHDPLREHVHRLLMDCHYAVGDRPSAIRQFRHCARVLEKELGLEPMPETLALRRRILEGRPPSGSARRPELALRPELTVLRPEGAFGPVRDLR